LDAESEPGLVQVDEYAKIFLRNALQRCPNELVAIAVKRSEDVPIHAPRVHPEEDVLPGFDLSPDQRHMYLPIAIAAIGDGAELPEFGLNATLGLAVDIALVLQAVADQLGHRDHLEAVGAAELRQLWHPRHGAVRVHDFADHAGRRKAGQLREIDGVFGLPGPHQDSTFPGA